MPLTKRTVSPVNVSLNRIPEIVQKEELQCVANGTLANLVRQLSSISRHAENIFGEIYHEVVKLDHKSNTLMQRVERLSAKVSQLDCCQEQISLTGTDLQLRKPFKSSCLIDQHTLDRQTLPSALAETYATCDQPPNLDALNPYRDDKKSALRYYTDPSYFFDLWREQMLKDLGDGRRVKQLRSPAGNKSPTRKKRGRHLTDPARMAPPSSRYIITSQQRTTDIMHLPAEYQAPQIAAVDQVQVPAGMSVPSANEYYARSLQLNQQISMMEDLPPPISSPKELSIQLTNLEIQEDPLLDDDDLPPPPPPLMHTSLVCQMPAAPAMQFVPPSETTTIPPPPPPPPPPGPVTTNTAAAVPSFAKTEENKLEKPTPADSTRSTLLAEIQTGIKLKQVRRKEQAAEEKAAAEANDVAAILRRRMEHVLGHSDSNSDTQSDDDEEWD